MCYNLQMSTWRIENRLQGRVVGGVTICRGLRGDQSGGLESFIAAALQRIRVDHARALPAGYELSRRLYRSLGVDPTRHRPSSEALWRRLRDRGDFPRVLGLVDLVNLLALEFQVPYGLYDLALLQPPLELDLGRPGETYAGIRKETLNMAGKIVLRDTIGPFGNPTSDSARAAVRETTVEMLLVIFLHPDDGRRREILDETAARYRRFFAAAADSCFV